MYSEEEKPNKQILWLVNISVMVAILLWAVAAFGIMPITNYRNDSLVEFLLAIKYEMLEMVAGTLMFILSVVVNHQEHRRVNDINKPWEVKPPKL